MEDMRDEDIPVLFTNNKIVSQFFTMECELQALIWRMEERIRKLTSTIFRDYAGKGAKYTFKDYLAVFNHPEGYTTVKETWTT